jgi:hypothetical protein
MRILRAAVIAPSGISPMVLCTLSVKCFGGFNTETTDGTGKYRADTFLAASRVK